jgi:hypothetical protein
MGAVRGAQAGVAGIRDEVMGDVTGEKRVSTASAPNAGIPATAQSTNVSVTGGGISDGQIGSLTGAMKGNEMVSLLRQLVDNTRGAPVIGSSASQWVGV